MKRGRSGLSDSNRSSSVWKTEALPLDEDRISPRSKIVPQSHHVC